MHLTRHQFAANRSPGKVTESTGEPTLEPRYTSEAQASGRLRDPDGMYTLNAKEGKIVFARIQVSEQVVVDINGRSQIGCRR
ncbi:MAG: hypothetical protein IPP15_23380 [Saprospiraceae bacterium]|uniref:Uncharacterized protein n=1 Tax=Candidatus Opimibacter skivensis TaxID=2982028 RepID=A0A9D7T2Q8_9BACT|nr:hypothetical protein [Candidatus Opimibacter skivensis]